MQTSPIASQYGSDDEDNEIEKDEDLILSEFDESEDEDQDLVDQREMKKLVLPQAKCQRCAKDIKEGDNRIRRLDRNWCFGCTACSVCKQDFKPVKGKTD